MIELIGNRNHQLATLFWFTICSAGTNEALFKSNQSSTIALLGKIDHLTSATSNYSLLKPDLVGTCELF